MISKYYKYLLAFCVGCGFTAAATSCSDFIYDDSDQVTYADKSILADDADTLWAVAGIMNKMQVIADRTILLGEVRGDLVSLTTDASADLRQLADFTVDGDNKYNQPRDYYAVINNCNYFLAHADTTLRNSRNERIFIKEYAAVKAFRAWTYLQLALNYGRVPFITTPILSLDDADATIDNQADLAEICRYFIADLSCSHKVPLFASVQGVDFDTAGKVVRSRLLHDCIQRSLNTVVDGSDEARAELNGKGNVHRFYRLTGAESGGLLVDLYGCLVTVHFNNLADKALLADSDDVEHVRVAHAFSNDKRSGNFLNCACAQFGFPPLNSLNQ